MLELKSITRTYKPKKGVPVQALKDISLSFEDSGMVFLLGKSGSGKSTLLNLIGGLDFADGGEIIIDGKSSKDFKQADYDSYRNTYVGFVFQEYNILNEFTVGENISLALELQSQKSDKNRLEEVLKEVDLEGYADRKPNELSGGQKQRVAIARAIIKDPKIIMADEPTGALDSETGKAIFDTLKRLSKDRLVIVVSHDREFAEQYGDRIIELADGELISDKTVASETATNKKPSVELKKSRLPYRRALSMGAKTMRRKRFRLAITILLCFLSFAAFGFADVMVSFDVKKTISSNFYNGDDNNYFSINAHITDFEDDYGSTEVCSEEDLQKIRELTGLDFQGVINAYYAPRVWNDELLESDNDIEYSELTYYSVGDRNGGSLPASQELFDALGFKLYGRLPSNEKEIVITRRRFDQYKIAGIDVGRRDNSGNDIIIYPEEIGDFQNFLDNIIPKINAYRDYTIVGVVDTFADADGRLANCNPKDDYTLNWTLIRYFEKGYHNLSFIHQSLYDKYIEENRVEDTTGFGRPVSGFIYGSAKRSVSAKGVATEESLKYVDKIVWLDGKGDRRELAENEIVIGCNVADFLWPEGSEKYESSVNSHFNKTFINGKVSFNKMSLYDLRHNGSRIIACLMDAEEISLQELEIYKEFCIDNFYKVTAFDNSRFKFNYTVKNENYYFDTMTEDDWRFSYACYLSIDHKSGGHYEGGIGKDYDLDGGYYNNVTGRKSGEQLIKENAVKIFVENRIENALSSARWTASSEDYNIYFNSFVKRDFTQQRNDYADIRFDTAPILVGIYFAKEGYPNDYMINDKAYYKSLDYEQVAYNYLIAPLSGRAKTKDVINLVTDLHFDYSQFRSFYCNNPIYFELQDLSVAYNTIKNLMYWIGGILGVFSILLLGSYIELSISSKKREIGILRAVGARKSDIFAIFINEAVIIASIVVVLAVMGAGFLTLGFNKLAPSAFGMTYNIEFLLFGIRQIAVILAVVFGTTAIASAIPLYKLSKKKPVDSIQDR